MLGADEVAAPVIEDPTDEAKGRDIIEYKDMGTKWISEIHPKFMSMQYSLLFPYREDGFNTKIPYQQKDGVTYIRNNISMLEFHAYYLHHHPDQSISLLMSYLYKGLHQSRICWKEDTATFNFHRKYTKQDTKLPRCDGHTPLGRIPKPKRTDVRAR